MKHNEFMKLMKYKKKFRKYFDNLDTWETTKESPKGTKNLINFVLLPTAIDTSSYVITTFSGEVLCGVKILGYLDGDFTNDFRLSFSSRKL